MAALSCYGLLEASGGYGMLHGDEEGRMLAAIDRYRKGGISTGAVAEWAGIPKTLFLMKLGEHRIDTFDMSAEELDKELDAGRRSLRRAGCR